MTLWTVVVSGIAVSTVGSLAQQSVTVRGVTYVGAELLKEYPQSIFIKHATGRSFVSKTDLSAEDARALGVTSPVADAFQDALDKDFHDLQGGKSYEPSAPPAYARQALNPASPRRVAAPRPTPHPSSIAAVQQEFRHFVETGDVPKPAATSAASRRAQEIILPDQPWMGNFDTSSVRLAMFKRGLLPLKESEARDLFAGREISSLSDRTALDAVKAAKVMLGQLGPEHLPRDYRALLRRGAPPAARVAASAPKSPTSIPFDSSIYPAAVAPAHAQPVAATSGDAHVHRMWHGADGSTATQVGNALFHSDGRISHGAFPAGGQFNTFHGSDGSVHHQSGNAMFPAGGGAGMFGAP